ncbi:VOC family protein [Microlunatus panaciterrae]|uniref:4a-hydroxytetrahydrobiopterin dehydratase n=1 Tax=Microlunatus panaciterrae TaxID=400768 RepID=A0ABS2RL45_9ACTN|nr:VOC family protein [Microlunatus panaciterrae]MBM7799738.1 4a-hydroxytetrahydrobiopterin dehydratase [Microlunatus panaciterrae]
MAETLTRSAASAAVADSSWRYLLACLATSVPVGSLAEAVQVAQAATTACGDQADDHLRIHLRSDRVELTLQTAGAADVTDTDVDLSGQITEAVAALGRSTSGVTSADGRRSVQLLEIAIDALDIPAIRPFWRAVMGYVDEPGHGDLNASIVDPVWQGPVIWFQQMDAPRPQRNRIHFDLTVPHDEAPGRLRAALEAGGRLVSEAAAPSFWVLADPEGNEVCICTWQERDDQARQEAPEPGLGC